MESNLNVTNVSQNNNLSTTSTGTHAIQPPQIYDLGSNAFDKNTYVILSSLSGTPKVNFRLPLPTNLDYNSSFNWSVEELGVMVGAIMKEIKGGGETKTNGVQNNNSYDDLMSIASEKVLQKLGEGASMLFTGGQTALKEYLKDGSLSYNPNGQLYFNGVTHREFSLSFELCPLSKEHGSTLMSAIKSLRVAASPDLIKNNVFFTYPSYFKMSVMVGGNMVFSRPSFAITSINVNLSPNGVMSYHPDGKPVNFTLDLDCIETTIATKSTEQAATFFS